MKAPGVVAPSLFPRGPSLLHSTRLGSAHAATPRHPLLFTQRQKKRKKKNKKKNLTELPAPFLSSFFFIPPPVCFCFPVPKSNYRRTNFYSFLKAWDCVGEGAGFFIFLFFILFFSFFTIFFHF